MSLFMQCFLKRHTQYLLLSFDSDAPLKAIWYPSHGRGGEVGSSGQARAGTYIGSLNGNEKVDSEARRKKDGLFYSFF